MFFCGAKCHSLPICAAIRWNLSAPKYICACAASERGESVSYSHMES